MGVFRGLFKFIDPREKHWDTWDTVEEGDLCPELECSGMIVLARH